MLRQIRKYFARSISAIDLPSTFIMNIRLQHPPNKLKEIELFWVFLKDTSDINLQIISSEVAYIFYFVEGTNQGITEYIYFDKIRSKPHFFSVALPEIENNGFYPITAEYYELGKCTLDNAEIRKINLADQPAATVNVEFYFNTPSSKEYLTTFIPNIKKINLLDNCDLLSPSQINKKINDTFSLQFNACTIKKINRLAFSYDTPVLSYTDFNIKHKNLSSINIKEIISFNEIHIENIPVKNQIPINDKIVHDNLIENYTEITDQKNLFEILYANEKSAAIPIKVNKPINIADPVKEEIIIKQNILNIPVPIKKSPVPPIKLKLQFELPSYIKDGVEFLLNTKFACFNDEFELRKEKQAVIALKYLIENKIVNKVLIVTEHLKCRFIDLSEGVISGLWQNNFTLYAPDIKYHFYEFTEKTVTTGQLIQNTVTGLTYDLFEECLTNGILNYDQLKGYDCIIFDDVSKATFQNDLIKHIMGKINPSYLWLLSDFDCSSLKDKIKKLFQNKSVNFFGRQKNNAVNVSLKQTYNIFLELDEQNIFVADRVYNDGRKKLEELLISGNLSRIIPNASQTVQEMQKLTNFILGTNSGNKSNLLRYHLDRVLNRNNRILIYSQFDAMGLMKIEDILKEMGIRFIKVSLTDSPQDIQKKINSVINTNEKLVYLLANINPKTTNLHFPEVSHLINFDNWWNPVTRRTIEEKLISNNRADITIYNYFYKDTLESRLINEMASLGITDKSLTNNITAEKFNQIYDEKNWCKIFNLSDDFSSYCKTDINPENIAVGQPEE